MTLHTKIANLVMFYTGEDIYSKRRTQSIVDARFLFEYIMREEYEVTYQSISDHYRKNGKKRNHDCIIYGVRLFKQDVAKRREDLNTYSKKIIMSVISSKQLKNAINLLTNIKTQEQLKEFQNFMNNILPEIKESETEPNKVL
jgi:hypothetical protein